MGATTSHRAAAEELARRDPVLAALVEAHGPPRLGPRVPVTGRFRALAGEIAHEQLAGRAARSIWARVEAAVGEPFTPEGVLAAGEAALRAAGLSGAKAASLLDLAQRVASGEVDLVSVARRDDEEVVRHLTAVRGIGPWTAHMFLLFTLRRPDVWPTGDYGVRAGFARAWGLDRLPTERELAALGEPYRPHRSTVAWYCWRAVDTVTPA